MSDANINGQSQGGEKNVSEEAHPRDILNRLKTIRVGKSKILSMLTMLKEKEKQGETIERNLIKKLIASYDSLKEQEEEFIIVIRRVANFSSDEFSESPLDSELENEIRRQHESDDAPPAATNADVDEMKRTLADLRAAAENSTLAASVHDTLHANIRLTQQKLDAMKLLYEKNMNDRAKMAETVVQKRENAKIQLSQERGELDRKQKLLARLRKKAAAKLLTAQPPLGDAADTVLVDTNDHSNTTLATNEERVPPVSYSLNSVAEKSAPKTDDTVDQKTQIAPAASDAITPGKAQSADDLHAHISTRFTAIEARKQRMRELRAQLNRAEHKKMDDAYGDALSRLQNLTEMRKQLESLKGNSAEQTANALTTNPNSNDNNNQTAIAAQTFVVVTTNDANTSAAQAVNNKPNFVRKNASNGELMAQQQQSPHADDAVSNRSLTAHEKSRQNATEAATTAAFSSARNGAESSPPSYDEEAITLYDDGEQKVT